MEAIENEVGRDLNSAPIIQNLNGDQLKMKLVGI